MCMCVSVSVAELPPSVSPRALQAPQQTHSVALAPSNAPVAQLSAKKTFLQSINTYKQGL